MAKFDVVDMNGKKVSTVELSDAVFGITPNEKAVHEAVVNFLANQRQGTQSTKIRKEVRGGGKKPWRQKGTGHARQGSIRAPQWTHGGVALGPKPRDYSYRINKKVKRLAVLSALSDKAANGNMIVVDKLTTEEYKTKTVRGHAGRRRRRQEEPRRQRRGRRQVRQERRQHPGRQNHHRRQREHLRRCQRREDDHQPGRGQET